MLAAAFSGIQVGLRPLFRHPGVYGTPLSGSRWVCGPSFGILVVSAPPLRDPSVFAPRPSGSWWGILWRHSVSCGARACGAFKSHAVSPGLIMARPPKGGAAAEAAAEATAAAIAKELRGKFDSEVVRKETLKMFTTFSGILDAEAVSKKIMAKREAKRAKNEARKAMAMEPIVPRMWMKQEWASIPEKLKIGEVFRCRADCDAIAMAYAESQDFGLLQKDTNYNTNRNYRCCGCNSFALHFGARAAESKIGADGEVRLTRTWVVNASTRLEHGPECNAAIMVSDGKTNPAYTNKILSFAVMANFQQNKNLKPSDIAPTIKKYLKKEPSAQKLSRIKEAALQSLDKNRASRAKGEKHSLQHLCSLITDLRKCGHIVEITTISGEEMQKILIKTVQAKYAMQCKEAKKKKKELPPPMSVADIKKSGEYNEIDVSEDTRYLYSIMLSPKPAEHFHANCRQVSLTDMCHVKGYYGGNCYYRYCPDANHHMVPMVMGYIVGNESQKSHTVANEFCKKVLSHYDVAGQVDVQDGDKGQYEAFVNVFQDAVPFLCTNHGRDAALAFGNTQSGQEYYVAAYACTTEDMNKQKKKFSEKTKDYLSQRPDEHQYIAAAQAQRGVHLHTYFTEQGAESQNAASLKFRNEDTPECFLRCMLAMHAKQHYKHRASWEKTVENNKLVPEKVAKELMTVRVDAQEYTCVSCVCPQSMKYAVGNIYDPSAAPYIVNLKEKDWTKRCCKKCARDHKVCAITAAAAESAGILLETLVDFTDTTAAWGIQYEDAPEFRVPPGGLVAEDFPTAIKLSADDDEAVEICAPPLIPRARGRPKTLRNKRLITPFAKPRKCSKCGKLTADHDARNCDGLSEISQELLPALKLKRKKGEVKNKKANDDKDEDDDADDDDDVDDDKYAEYKEYSIGALLDKRDTDDGDEYLVHWRGFDDDDDSWEPEEAIPKKMIQRFLALSKAYDDKYKKKTLGIQEVNSQIHSLTVHHSMHY